MSNPLWNSIRRRTLSFDSLESRDLLSVTSVSPVGDANGDGIINGQDIAAIASLWLHTLPLAGGAAASAAVGATGEVDGVGSVAALVAPQVASPPANDGDTMGNLSMTISVSHAEAAGISGTTLTSTARQHVLASGRDFMSDGSASAGADVAPPQSGTFLTAGWKPTMPEVSSPVGKQTVSPIASYATSALAARDELFSRLTAFKPAVQRPTNALQLIEPTNLQSIALDMALASEFAPESWPLHKRIRHERPPRQQD